MASDLTDSSTAAGFVTTTDSGLATRRGALSAAVSSRARRREHVVSDRLIVTERPNASVRLRRPMAPALNGRLTNALNGYPLAEMTVTMCTTTIDTGKDGGASERVLGSAVSGADGRFSIAPDDTSPLLRQQFALLPECRPPYYLKVGRGTEVYSTTPQRPGAALTRLDIAVPLPTASLPRTFWSSLSTRLESARLVQLHAILTELVGKPSAVSLAGDSDLLVRHTAAAELEQAFIDPDGVLRGIASLPSVHALRQPGGIEAYVTSLGASATEPAVATALAGLQAKVASFGDLFEVDWVIDIGDLGAGKLGKATTKNQDQYLDSSLFGDLGGAVLQAGPPSPLQQYRDYLRAIFTGPVSSPSWYGSYKAKLETRFHQDFGTSNTTEQPANQVLVPIVKAILTASTGLGCGFGLDPATLPVQGVKSYREHLDELIALTGLSARELGLRYRIDLERPDTALSSAVAENVATLQGFYADGFQSTPDSPLWPQTVPGSLYGRAPFFLQYDEWLQLTKPDYPENYHEITQTFTSGVVPDAREHVERNTAVMSNASRDSREDAKWVLALMDIEAEMNEGHHSFGLAQYAIAMDHYETSLSMAVEALQFYEDHGWEVPAYNAPYAIEEPYIGPYDGDGFSHYDNFAAWSSHNRAELLLGLVHLMAYVLPVCQGDTAMALGDYAAAVAHYGSTTRFLVATVDSHDALGIGAYQGHQNVHDSMGGQPLHVDGTLPYTADLPAYRPWPQRYISANAGRTVDMVRFFGNEMPAFADIASKMATSMERRFLRLRQGNAILEWADALFRTDDRASIARARELYKAALFLHGSQPPIRPQWDSAFSFVLHQHNPNPALVSQLKRARRGFDLIALGLNYYGVNDDLVPLLRYRTLKDAADRLAAAAKGAQQDFLNYLGRVEDAIKEGLVNANMLKKATLQGQIAQEQVKVAEFNVMVAEQQVAQVEAAIDAKKQEIADYGGWEILGDLVGGMVDAVTAFADNKDVKAAAAANSATEGSATTSSLGATAGAMGAVAMVVYAGVVSCVALQDGMDQRTGELHALQDVALPMAKANLDARQSELKIAQLQQDIAAADAELAVALVRFEANRTLNIEFWNSMATVVKRALRRYLELAARFAWLAERALQYEQDRALDIVRFDYFPRRLQGASGADLLLLDLAELEAARLEGIKRMVPIKHTYSMMVDFPLAFAQLKAHGRCSFRTTELPFRYAYPGTYGYRMIGVSVAVRGLAGGLPARGLLRNQGVSQVSRDDGESHVSVRFPDALPLSEFQLRDDRAVYRLPDETLMSFEGSGVDTFWELSFPTIANPYGLSGVADIELTFDVRASYSSSLYDAHVASTPASVSRFLFFSAATHAAADLAALTDPAPGAPSAVTVTFSPAQIGLPLQEANRVVTNLLLFLASETPLALPATFGPQGNPVALSLAQNMARSNAGAWSDPASPAPEPLNQCLGVAVEQNWVLTIDKAQSPAIDFSGVADVVLGIEYSAALA